MLEVRQGLCTRQGRAHARDKAGLMHESRQGGCARQGKADALGK
jgi:hypothetical protein